MLPDGTIDADRALEQWGKNTDPSMQRGKNAGTVPAPDASSLKPASGPDVSIARAALIIEKEKREENSTIERLPTAAWCRRSPANSTMAS